MSERWTIPGSHRAPMAGTRAGGDAKSDEECLVTVYVRARSAPAADAYESLTREDFTRKHGAAEEDLRAVEEFAKTSGLEVVSRSVARRCVMLRGTVAQFSKAFSVSLKYYEGAGTRYRGREGDITVPSHLANVVSSVLGLDNRPQARPHFKIADPSAVTASYTPPQVGTLYEFPAPDGTGECIGIVELGGGYSASDFNAYCSQLGITPANVTVVLVDGATNQPGADTNADTEVMLDVEITGTLAPKARIAVYFAPNTDQGFVDAVTTAVHDTTNKPSVISISWGGPESSWTQQAVTELNSAIQSAGTVSVSVCCASGDSGSSDGVNDGQPHVDFPASSPYALGCGGTTLGSGSGGETAWSGSGGGVSTLFALPSWQSKAGVPTLAGKTGRGVPDVCGDADPNTGYQIRVDGQSVVVGGTSAVAPLWSALIALANQRHGSALGFINATLYGLQQKAVFTDITSGSNGAYKAGPGWDACTGLGRPDGTQLAQALSA